MEANATHASMPCDACGSMPMEHEVHMGKPMMNSAPMIDSWSEPMHTEGSSVVMPMETLESSRSDAVVPTKPTPAAEPKPAVPEAPKAVKPMAPAAEAKPAAPAVKPVLPVEPPPMDDLFGAPAAEPALPAAEPAGAPVDDLFGAPVAEPAVPAEAPAAGGAMDDLFGDKPNAPADVDPPAAGKGMDDLFGAPAADAPADAPADAAPAAAEDIFGVPAAAVPAAEPAKDAVDDLFGSQQTEPVDPLANSRIRVWIDNTGEFSTEGRLIEISSDYIRLAKANGKTCTVPNSRLCPADVAYVGAVNHDRSDIKVAMVSTSR